MAYSEKGKKKHSWTKLLRLGKGKQKGRKIPIDVVDGKPTCLNKEKLMSFVGVVARTNVSISIPNWKRVDDATKEMLWLEITSIFEGIDSIKHNLMIAMGESWRSWKSRMYKDFVENAEDEVKYEVPKDYNFITKEDWVEFVNLRSSQVARELSALQSGRAKSQRYYQTTSRKGYVGLELEMQKKSESTDRIPREELWKATRIRKSGAYVNAEAAEMAARIDYLKEQQTQGSLEAVGRDDILSHALGPEHPGRIRAARKFETIKSFFKDGRRRSTSSVNEAAFFTLQEQVTQQQQMYAEERRLWQEQQQINEEARRLWEQEKQMLDKRQEEQAAAIARLQEFVMGRFPLTTQDTPMISPTIPLVVVSQPPITAPTSECPYEIVQFKTYRERMQAHAFTNLHASGSMMHMPLNESVFGRNQDINLDYYDVQAFVSVREIGASIVSSLCTLLYTKIQNGPFQNAYQFVDPSLMSDYASVEDRIEEMTKRLKEGPPGVLTLVPFNSGAHWMLIIVDASESILYWFDPLRNPIRPNISKIVREAMLEFIKTFQIVNVKPKLISIKCPRQYDNVQCGHFVMQYMNEIINCGITKISNMIFKDKDTYSVEVLDRMNEELAEFIWNNWILKENKEKKDAEFNERFKHRPPKALDEDETEFYDKLEMSKREYERQIANEEAEQLRSFQEAVAAQALVVRELKDTPIAPKPEDNKPTAKRGHNTTLTNFIISMKPQAKKAKIEFHSPVKPQDMVATSNGRGGKEKQSDDAPHRPLGSLVSYSDESDED